MSLIGRAWHLGHDPQDGDFEWWEYHGPHPVKRWWKRRVEALTYELSRHGSVGNVLILGCGSSPSINKYAGEGHTVVGVDISGEKLRFLQGRTQAKLVKGDITLPFIIPAPLPQRFDLIICNEVLEHLSWEGVNGALGNVGELLRKNGRVVISIPDESESRVGRVVERVLHGDIHRPITMEKIKSVLYRDWDMVEIANRNHMWVRISCFEKLSS